MGQLVHDYEVGGGTEGAVGDNVGHFKSGQRAGDGQNQVENNNGPDGGDDDALEPLPDVDPVDLGGLVEHRVHGGDGADEEHNVLAHVLPQGAGHQDDVVDGGVLQPVGGVGDAHPAQQGVQHEAGIQEELEPTAMPQMRQGKYSAPRKNLLPRTLKLRIVAKSSARAIWTTEPAM